MMNCLMWILSTIFKIFDAVSILSAPFYSSMSVLSGCLFTVLAWIQVIRARPTNGRWNIPIALYTFSAFVCLGLLDVSIYWIFSYSRIWGINLLILVIPIYFISSFVLLPASL